MKVIEFQFIVDEESGSRLDAVLMDRLSMQKQPPSRTELQKVIREQGVLVNEKLEFKTGKRLEHGDRVEVHLQLKTQEYIPEPYEYQLNVLYEDEHICVLNKPHGIAIHPGAGNPNQTILNAVVYRYGVQKLPSPDARYGIVHRIDKDTSGLLVIALSAEAHKGLSAQFANHSVGREYVGLVLSSPRQKNQYLTEDGGVVDAAIARSKAHKLKMAIDSEGKWAKTHFLCQVRYPYGLLMKFKLETGRTHQIRVHMSSIGAPLIGDPLYGEDQRLPTVLKRAAKKLGRQALHAQTLSFVHPLLEERMSFVSDIPEDMQECIKIFESYSM